MKFHTRLFILVAILAMAILAGYQHGAVAALAFATVGTAAAHTLIFGIQSDGCLRVSLITDLLTGKVIKPLRTKVPELNYFSVDWGRMGGEYAPPVKFGQTVISHMLTAPTAEAFVPGAGLGSSAANVKDLITDAQVKIDLAAKVSIKLPTADAVKYILDPAFKATLEEATVSLGRYVVGLAVAKFTEGNFSQEKVATVAAVEYESLMDTRAALNKLGTLAPRFVLGETDWVNKLAKDPDIASGDYHGQRVGEDPYITLVNIAGFSAVREFPNMPTNTVLVGNAAIANAGDLFTLNAHGLANGTRVRFTSIVTSTGISTNTDYYVIGATTNTFQVSLTVGGAAVVIGTGDGTANVSRFEAVNAVAFERRAIHIAFRPLLDNAELAMSLGIPPTSKKIASVDPDTGLTVTWHFWEDNTGTNPTGDVFATAVVAFGITAGREITGSATPGSQAAGSGMDYAAIRLVETAGT